MRFLVLTIASRCCISAPAAFAPAIDPTRRPVCHNGWRHRPHIMLPGWKNRGGSITVAIAVLNGRSWRAKRINL